MVEQRPSEMPKRPSIKIITFETRPCSFFCSASWWPCSCHFYISCTAFHFGEGRRAASDCWAAVQVIPRAGGWRSLVWVGCLVSPWCALDSPALFRKTSLPWSSKLWSFRKGKQSWDSGTKGKNVWKGDYSAALSMTILPNSLVSCRAIPLILNKGNISKLGQPKPLFFSDGNIKTLSLFMRQSDLSLCRRRPSLPQWMASEGSWG